MHKLTQEQIDILNHVTNSNDNLLASALAGTGKSYILKECIKLLPKDRSIMSLSFNRHIKQALVKELPEYVKSYTTYGLGNAAILRKYKDKIILDEFKIDKIIQKKSKSWGLNSEFETEDQIKKYLQSIKKMCDLCRLTLTLKPEYIQYLIDSKGITGLGKPADIKRIMKVLDTATNDRSTYDYTDMIYLPAIDNSIWMFPQDYVALDEGQDFNRCQIKIVEKILKKDKATGKITGRLFTFGDPNQMIYGFNGSDEKVIDWFKNFGTTKILPLTTSFRCSNAVIREAQKIIPDIKAMDDAPEGSVTEGSVLKDAKSGDFVLCRTVKPLIKLFFQLLVQHKKAIIKGSDIGISIIELIGDNKDIPSLTYYWENELKNLANSLRNTGILNPEEHSDYIAISDKAYTLLFLAKYSKNIEDLKIKIKTIFTDEEQGIILCTVHRMKGLESNRVFIVRPDLLPMKNARTKQQQTEEMNIKYIAITRARIDLVYDVEWTNED